MISFIFLYTSVRRGPIPGSWILEDCQTFGDMSFEIGMIEI